MINTWSELYKAVKDWFHAPIKFERKPEITTQEANELLRPKENRIFGTEEWNKIQREGLKKVSDLYFNHLRDRLRAGETLSSEEMYRLRMYYRDPSRPRNPDIND